MSLSWWQVSLLLDETTTFVSRSFDATIDAARSIVLTRKQV